MAEDPLHPDELSRRISEIDLTNLRRRSDTLTGNPPRYTQDQLLAYRPDKKDGAQATVLEMAEGLKTPPNVPAPPPPTPSNHPGSPPNEDAPDGHEHAKDGDNENDAEADDEATGDAIAGEAKKKKKKKRGGRKKHAAPTGFEEFYADPPITPDEHDEEYDIYAASRAFHERMQSCIQRYRKKRNLDSVRANILTKYFMLGGVESSSTKAFTGGLDEETLADATAAEIAAIQATDHIRSGVKNAKYYDPASPEHWVVDFEGVAKGFLSGTVTKRFALYTEDEIKQICAVIRNFLNYVLAHGVCPEHTKDVLAARKVCDMAEKELWSIRQIQQLLPGDFNVAASTLYGGHYQGIGLDDSAWASEDKGNISVDQGFVTSQAERVFKTAIAFAGSQELFLKAIKGNVDIVKTEKRCFEVIGIERASIQTIEEYGKILNHKGESGIIKALGVLHVKPWDGPGIDEEDMTDDEGDDEEHHADVESFWLEDFILQQVFVGLKLEVVASELSIGIKFFDQILGLYCSFYTTLHNEKVIEMWKEPNLNTRAPPTEDDPDAEENAMALDEEKELDDFEKDLNAKDIKIVVADATPKTS